MDRIIKNLLMWGWPLLLLATLSQAAVDYPHADVNGITCYSCHDIHADTEKFLRLENPHEPLHIDDTPANNLCWSCHNNSIAPRVDAHSSRMIDDGYGEWAIECVTCHNPHKQDQFREYDNAETVLTSGMIDEISNTSITSYGAGWTVDEFKGLIVFTRYDRVDDYRTTMRSYRILSNTEDTLTISLGNAGSGINLSKAQVGDLFAVAYGRLVKTTIDTPNSGPKEVKFLRATGANSFADSVAVYDGPCQVCHTQTKHMRNDGLAPDQWHDNVGGAAGQKCTELCHLHKGGFAHGTGVTDDGCVECHGHEAGTIYGSSMNYPYTPGTRASQGRGTTVPHSTHTESTIHISPLSAGDDDLRGPGIYCDSCHDITAIPSFKSGTDLNGDGKFNLAETDVCDGCHSPGGAYNGVDSTGDSVGAKDNWHTEGVYEAGGTTLKAGKEKWCVGCHDQGTAVINGRQAPDTGGDGATYGFYASGHGSKAQECQDCHDLSVSHNFDGQKTYLAASDNYQIGYRLKDVDGQPPMNIPLSEPPYNTESCDFDEANYRLCLTCHESYGPSTMGTAENLFTNTDDGGQECGTNPYYVGPEGEMVTGFRNESNAGYSFGSDVPGNGHWDHLVDFSNVALGALLWKSDDTGAANSRVSCPACHNPHGAGYGATEPKTPTTRMTRSLLQIEWGTDGTYGDYGVMVNENAVDDICSVSCHFGDDPGDTLYRYYREHTSPQITGITLADSDGVDPIPAEAGYTNDRTVAVTFNISNGVTPTHMQCAEDISFSVNPTGWIAYTGPTMDYTLSDSDGTKTAYCQLRNLAGSSHIRSNSILLDRVAPTVATDVLTAPNGGQSWLRGTVQNIIWTPGSFTDDNLKAGSVISLEYSTDGGISFPNSITTGEADDGTYAWTIPVDDSPTARVQVSSYDKAGNRGSDGSDSNFTIMPFGPTLDGLTVADNDSADPTPAEAGYTNSTSVAVTLTTTNFPTEMMLAENAGFTANSTGWIPYSANYTYTLTSGNETKTIYAKVRNGAGETGALSDTITLDTVPPTMLATTLISPNGGESWDTISAQDILWNSANITDDNLKATPIQLEYSANGGTDYSVAKADEANDGAYSWTVPPTATNQGMVRIVAYDRAGNTSVDTSNAVFTIVSAFIVTNTNDTGDGSLRKMMTDLIGAGGNGTISFNIPLGLLTNGVAVISPASALPVISAPNVIIDGTTQTTNVGNTNTYGPEIRVKGDCSGNNCLFGAGFDGLVITSAATDVTIKGLQLTNLRTALDVDGDRALLKANYVGISSDSTGYYDNDSARNLDNISIAGENVTLGGVSPADGNAEACAEYSGTSASGAGVQIINNLTGLKPDGTVCPNYDFSSGSGSIYVTADNALIQGNVFAGGPVGLKLAGSQDSTVVKGNTFGAWYSGGTWLTLAGPATGIDVNGVGVSNVTIGGPNVATNDATLNDSNVFNSATIGIRLFEATDFTPKVFGNFVGTNPEQDEVFAGTIGIYAGRIDGMTIGGGDAGEAGNVIANMSSWGIQLYGDAYNGSDYVEISRNSFYNNGDDLLDDAIFLNDSYAALGTPVIRPTISSAGTTSVAVEGVVSGDVVEVYIADFSGTEYGEGKTFVGSATATGTSVDVPVSGVSIGQYATALYTSSAGRTSAFSSNTRISGPAVPTLEWTNETNYTSDGVDPQSALSSSDFTFRVKYTDADNDPPQKIEVWVDLNDNDAFDSGELLAMEEVNTGDTVYSDGKLYTLTRSIVLADGGTVDYRFYATDSVLDATGTPTVSQTITVVACDGPTVNAAGTYFEAENHTSSIAGSSGMSAYNILAGYNGTDYLGTDSGATHNTTPPTSEGRSYKLYFPAAGTYNVWLRGYMDYGCCNYNAIYVGLNGGWTGALGTTLLDQWAWDNNVELGSNTITVPSAGNHKFNIWYRDAYYNVDGFYLTTGAETPTDALIVPGNPPTGVTVVDPSVCP